MAITVDWALTKVITIPKADMTLVQLTPVEVRRLDTDAFFRTLKDLESSEEGMPWSDTQRNASPVTLAGITYARVLEILDPYSITFEDGQYVVELVGSNNNIIEKTNPNQVSVQGNNSAGLIQTEELQYSAYQEQVTIDQTNSTGRAVSGQAYPAGTLRAPCLTLSDALFIAGLRGFKKIGLLGDFTFLTTDVLDDFIVCGESFTKTLVILTPQATITNCKFIDCDVDGQLDGGNELVNCRIENLNYIDGALIDCELEQTIIINGVQADFIRCYSGVAGGGIGQTPTIDMNGGGHDLIMRDYQGGIRLINDTMGADNVSIDLSSGRVILDSTITAGTYTLRGLGTLEDSSSGTAVVNDQLLDPIYFRARLTNIDDVVKHIEQYVFVDTELLVNGDGSARSPYNNVTDAKDYAEANEIFQIITYSELTLDRTIKNFNIIGIGQPVIDMNGQSVDKCRFSYCTLRGQYTGSIVAQNSVLDDTFYLNGFFENCGVNGTLTCIDGGNVLLKNCASIIAGLGRPTISMNGTGSSNLAIRDWQGGLTITDCNNALDAVTVEVMGGSLTFDATCTAGTMVARGLGKFVDNSNGATVIDETAYTVIPDAGTGLTIAQATQLEEIWQDQGLDPANPLTISENGNRDSTGIDVNAVTSGTSPNRQTTLTRQ